ncbi:Molybdopterin synthase catalytic subunit [Oleoguttula sp. CCFEE 6159]|nr:Molybdopterin synthase catalytic subunit [Oleoguttula sp. CCFEE 6159]
MAATATQSKAETPMSITEPNIHVELTYDHLDVVSIMNRVRSPKAGAIVLFAVQHLSYSSYPPLALRTLLSIARSMHSTHGLTAIALIHRLGTVPIGEESILIAVSAPHRQAAWRAGEEALEVCKEKTEVWKLEVLGEGGGSVWRANRDGQGQEGKVVGGEQVGVEGEGVGRRRSSMIMDGERDDR